MKSTLEMLLKFDEETDMMVFLQHLEADFRKVRLPKPDPLKQADNVLHELFILSRKNPETFKDYPLLEEKILSIVDRVGDTGEHAYLLNEFLAGLQTVHRSMTNPDKKNRLDAILIHSYMEDMFLALERNEEHNFVQACMKLRSFCRYYDPKIRADQIKRFIEETLDPENISKYNLAWKILDLSLLSWCPADFFNGLLNDIENSKVIAEDNVRQNFPGIKKQFQASKMLEKIKKETEECRKYLSGVISSEAEKLPQGGAAYFNVENQAIQVNVFNTEKIAHDLNAREDRFAQEKYYSHASPRLRAAATSYRATQQLLDVLQTKTEDQLPLERLERFKTQYKEEIPAFQSNPDSRIRIFAAKIKKLLTSLFKAPLAQDSPILPPRELKKSIERNLGSIKSEPDGLANPIRIH